VAPVSFFVNTQELSCGPVLIKEKDETDRDVPGSTFALPEGYAIRDIAPANNETK
jgi:hypothetical protein